MVWDTNPVNSDINVVKLGHYFVNRRAVLARDFGSKKVNLSCSPRFRYSPQTGRADLGTRPAAKKIRKLCESLGEQTSRRFLLIAPEETENIINLVHADYLQIDCKGHPGVSSYPTKVGHPVPGFVGDPLRVWREVTARRGVGLSMHCSGVWDSHAVHEHSDGGTVNADSKPNGRATSFFGPYADKLLIPQLRELAGDYTQITLHTCCHRNPPKAGIILC